MYYKLFDLTIFLLLAALGMIVVYETYQLPEGFGGDVGAGYFPRLIGWLLVAFCAIGALASVLSKAKTIKLGNPWLPLVTLALIAGFVWSWSRLGYFYLQLPIFLFLILGLYRAPRGLGWKAFAIHAAISLGVSAAFYIVFQHFMYVSL